MIFAPQAYYGPFRTGYNNAKCNKLCIYFATKRLLNCCLKSWKAKIGWAMYGPNRTMFWIKRIENLEFYSQPSDARQSDMSYKTCLTKSIYFFLRAIVSKAESVTYHLVTNDKNNVSIFDRIVAKTNPLFSFEYKWVLHLFVQICKECRHATTFFINRTKNARNACNELDHNKKVFFSVQVVSRFCRIEVIEGHV